MARDRRQGPTDVIGLRALFEPYRPGGWWRRDLLLEVLDAAYPHWLTAKQVHDLCCILRPDYRHPRGGWEGNRTARSLGRLHSYRMVDRYGKPNGWARPGSKDRGGYRYRLIRDKEELL